LGLIVLLILDSPWARADTSVTVDWSGSTTVSRTLATLQVVTNPKLEPGSPLYSASFDALKALNAKDARYVPWFPYPRLGVAELDPPTATGTSWDFMLVDPAAVAFAEASQGRDTIWNFSTIPAWMFKSSQPITPPSDPSQVFWGYNTGTELVDPTCKQLAGYYARLVSWYTRGGFMDENGTYHRSGHHFPIAIWEVLNEPEGEHQPSPQQSVKEYDAIVAAIHQVSPKTQFMGLALAFINTDTVRYFLTPSNHAPGTPLDWVSFHHYGILPANSQPDAWKDTLFTQADAFLKQIDAVIAIRNTQSPQTRIDLDEIGTMEENTDQIPPLYWNASAAQYAYVYFEAARRGIDVVGESQLVGYPTQYPSVSMMDWNTDKPNARYWALTLIKDNFGPGDRLVNAQITGEDTDIAAQGFLTRHGRRLLLINKQYAPITVTLGDAAGKTAQIVDEATSEGPARRETILTGRLTLAPYAVAVVNF
jgi:hypothetical protein